MTSLTCGIWNTTQTSLLRKTEADTQTQETSLWLPKGKVGKDRPGVWKELIYTALYIKQINTGWLYSTGGYAQYLVITDNGKESEKECTHTYTHITVHLNHCKPTILRLKKRTEKDTGAGYLCCGECVTVSDEASLRIQLLPFFVYSGLACGLDGKESACNVGDLGLIPGSGRSPGEGNDNLIQ